MAIAEIILVFISFLIIVWHWSCNRNSPITNWPVLGMLPGVLHNAWRINDYTTQLLKQSDRSTLVFKGPWFSNLDFVLTGDPMNVNHIFNKKFANYPRGDEFKMIMEPLGDGIFNSDGDMWRIQKKSIHSIMNHNKFQSTLLKIIHQKLEKGLIPILDHFSILGVSVDMQDLFQRFTFDNICLLVLGFDPNCLSVEFPKVAYQKAFDDMEEGVLYRHMMPESLWKLQKWLQIGEEKKLSRAWEIFDKFLYECISSKRRNILSRRKITLEDETEEEEFDFLTPFLVKEDNEMSDVEKSDKFIRDMAFNLLAAGRDSLSAGLVWFIWLVATHPSVEKLILEELKAKNIRQGDGGGEGCKFFNADEVSKLVYLHGAICESLRLYPPVPFEHRCSVQEDILPSGHRVNANTKLLFSIYSMGRNEEIWGKDCLEFKPERWISEQGRILHVPSYKFFTFTAGPRTCLGKDMAFLQMKIAAISIIWNYQVHVEDNHPIIPSPSVVLHMKYGLKVRVTKRHV